MPWRELSEEDVWWRPNQHSNSAGNILLHLCGNLRQWIVHGIGGAEDRRERDKEFAERGPIVKTDLLAKLEAVIDDVCRVLDEFDASQILEKRTIQGFDETCLTAIFHVVELFAQHLGQLSCITKLRRDMDLKNFNL